MTYLNGPHRERDTGSPQAVDQVRSLKRSCDLGTGVLFVARRTAAADMQDGEGGQPGRDLVLAYVQVRRPVRPGAGGAGIAVATAFLRGPRPRCPAWQPLTSDANLLTDAPVMDNR